MLKLIPDASPYTPSSWKVYVWMRSWIGSPCPAEKRIHRSSRNSVMYVCITKQFLVWMIWMLFICCQFQFLGFKMIMKCYWNLKTLAPSLKKVCTTCCMRSISFSNRWDFCSCVSSGDSSSKRVQMEVISSYCLRYISSWVASRLDSLAPRYSGY